MASTVTMTSENAGEFLEAAEAATNEAEGITPESSEPTDPAATEADGSEEAAEPAKVDGLEIQEKEAPADESKTEETGDGPSFDMAEVFAEYAETGEIAPETNDKLVEALEGAGFGDQAQAIIDQYMAGATASVETVRQSAFLACGGEDQYAAMAAWAADNVPTAELAAFNEAVATPAMVPLAVRGLYAQYQAANGGAAAPQAATPPARVAAGANVQSGLAPVTSLQQIAEITADPRYDADPGFRAQQDARIKASMDAGVLK